MKSIKEKEHGSEKNVASFSSLWMRSKVYYINEAFNSLSILTRRKIAITCGIAAAATALILTIRPFYSEQENIPLIKTITLPLDIYEHNEMEQYKAKLLIPIGKMKGEIDGVFEAFYIAIDNEGTIFINRDPVYGEDRFLKTNGWDAITNEQFRLYEKALHFVPHNRKGLTP